MGFKVGDKVILTNIANWYGGELEQNEECVVTSIGFSFGVSSDPVIWVRNTKGTERAVYSSWASINKLKNQQLLFDFMYKD